MLVRIKFSDTHKVDSKVIQDLQDFMLEEVASIQLVEFRTEDDGPTQMEFMGWRHTRDPQDPKIASGDKVFVRDTEIYRLSTEREYIVDLELFMARFPQLSVSIRGTCKSPTSTGSQIFEHILSVEQKLVEALKAFDKKVEFNTKCNVHVPNLGMLSINQVGIAKDYCTEALQEKLNEGWRILTVCPQPDQRRPDYILGRYIDEKLDVSCIYF